MKIALITFHAFFQPGGVKNHVLGLHNELKRKGIQSKIIAPRRSRSEDYGKDVILLGTSFPINFSGSRSDLDINFNPLSIERTLKREKFDVLHFHNFGFPSIVQILERSNSVLNVLTIHSNFEGSNFLKKFPSFIYIFNKIIQWKIDGVIGVAPLNLKVLKKFRGPARVIPNGINTGEFNPENPKIEKFNDNKVNILFVGRIEKRKGLVYLLKAYKILNKNLSDLRLIIVGDGPLKEESQNWARENNIKEVYFEGEKNGKELASYYTTADIFVSPAIFGESFGIVLLEAMASGTPVVAFANQGYREFLKGKEGEKFLAKSKNYTALAEKIEILIKNPNLRKEMGEWGKKEAQNYSWSKITDQVLNFYKDCRGYKKNKPNKRKNHFIIDKMIKKLYNKKIINWLNWFKKLK